MIVVTYDDNETKDFEIFDNLDNDINFIEANRFAEECISVLGYLASGLKLHNCVKHTIVPFADKVGDFYII